MPTVFRIGKYRFFFFAREESREHIHIISPEGEAKFWLKPKIELAKNYGFSDKELKMIEKKENYDEFINAWKKFFG
ncbi:MAG: DUF4160 domain-containing protein [Epsilonproteobacteria bacterium]|nr:DUF4160 domain-containing protein [Campylobacterota bacterium]